MTTPTAAKSTAPAKTAKADAKDTNVQNSTPATENKAVEVKSEEKNRIPQALADQSILNDFCERYLNALDEIAEYNKAVLAEKDSEWNSTKVLDKARELARPTNKDAKPNEEIKKALENWEKLITETAKARKAVIDLGANALGITLSSTAERDPAIEAPLKEKRKFAVEIGTQLSTIAKMTSNEAASQAVTEFLANNPLPAIGRDQTRSFGDNGGKATPKYRVTVTIYKNGEELLSESGFTKTALELTKSQFGYERGKAPKSEDLRKVWETAGNTPEKTVKDTVEFEDNGLQFVITKK